MELRPGEPERLVAAEIGPVGADRLDAAGLEPQANVLEGDLIASRQRQKRLAPLERHRFAGGGDDADDVFVNRQARVHIADRKYGAVGIPAVAEVEIAAKRQFLDQHGRPGVQFLPSAPIRGDDRGLLEPKFLLRQRPGHRRAQKRIEHRKRLDVVHHLVGPDQQPRRAQDGPPDPFGQPVGEIGLRRTAERAVGNAQVPAAQGVVDHLAHFHDAARIGPVLPIHPDPENDVPVLEPCRVFGAAHLGIVGGGNAVARLVRRVVRAVVDQHAAPGNVPPVDIAFDEDLVPAGHHGREYGALYPQIVGGRRNVPRNEMIGDGSPMIADGRADPQQPRGGVAQFIVQAARSDEAHQIGDEPDDAGVLPFDDLFQRRRLIVAPPLVGHAVDESHLHRRPQGVGQRAVRDRRRIAELLDDMVGQRFPVLGPGRTGPDQ